MSTGKTALVTGSSRGIGRAIAQELAACGASVAVNYVRGEVPARALCDEIQRGGGRAYAIQADVRDAAHCARLVEQALSKLGHLDILVNNAGITRDRTVRRMGDDEWTEVLDTNLTSVFRCTKAALDGMMARKGGRIVNVASIIGQTGNLGQSNYAAAKAGLIGFTKSVAQEVARYGITVNAVCPGFIDTDMLANVPADLREKLALRIPLGRFGAAADVAKMVRFLVAEGDWITGQQLNVNGGMYM